MSEIQGKAKSVRELLKGVKYSIDYYQREYKWRAKQISELVDDLSGEFLQDYDPAHGRKQVAGYAHYFLGSIIISRKDGSNYIVDGQQRLTSLTLLLIYLRHLQVRDASNGVVNVDELIVSELFGQKSFNLQVEERAACMDALFESGSFELGEGSESVENIVHRYEDLDGCFPAELRGPALPFFIDWLLENVDLVEITAYTDDDAYAVFETMNDRGLSLTPTEMLKGYLLSNIDEIDDRAVAERRWRDRVLELTTTGKDVEPDFFKTWLRSQYATKIRERKRGAKPEDFDRIGTEFHRWLRETSESIGLKTGSEFERFLSRDFDFYSRQYLGIVRATQEIVDGLEHIYYNAGHGFTLQHLLLLAPLKPEDADDIVRVKLRLVARFVDILLTWRLWNFRSIAYATMQYAMFIVSRDIRGLNPADLAATLTAALDKETETFETNGRLHLHQQNRWYLHRVLARITDFVETGSDLPSRYPEYVHRTGGNRYEVEHIWANHPERHEFENQLEFADYRNRFGGLLLLPKSFNASYGDMPYETKLPHYVEQNLLARSLHPQCYEHNPRFLRFIERTGLAFKPHAEFKKADLDARQELYRALAEQIWNPEDLLGEMDT